MRNWIAWLFELDPKDLASSSDWRMDFAAEYGGAVLLALLVGLAVLGYLVIRSYRREGSAPPAVKATLASLRLLVAGIAVALLFRPALVLQFIEMRYATVVVALDDSASMGATDRYVGHEVDDPGAKELAELLELDPAELNDMPRRELLRRALLRPDGALARLARRQDVVLMRFAAGEGDGDYVRGMTVLPAAARDDDDAVDLAALREALAGLSAAGRETDLATAVEGALARTAGRRLSGLVVFSDGQVTVNRPVDGLKRARRLAAQRRVPLCGVCVGRAWRHVRNVGVVAVRPPAKRIRRGERATFTVKLLHALRGPHDVVVELRRRRPDATEWTEVTRSDPVALPSGVEPGAPAPRESIREVEIALTPEEIGTELGEFVYQARVAPLEDETNADDNAATVRVEICDETVNVLLVGRAGWEFQYLRSFLLRHRRIGADGKPRQAFRVTVWQQDADTGVNLDASTGMKLTRLPRKLETLIGSSDGDGHPGYDVVILYDPQPTQGGVDETFAGLLKKFVQDHGGGLCYIAGRKHTESVMGNREVFDALSDLLPVRLGRNEASRIEERIHNTRPRAYRVVLRDRGRGHPLMRLGPDGEQAPHVWAVLPGIYWSQAVYEPKPLARVLAVSSNPWHQTGAGEPEPVLAVHNSGRGRVLYVGFDSTWRWRYPGDGAYFRRFWTNVTRYLGPLKIARVLIETPKRQYDVGERVGVDVEAYDEAFDPLTDPSYRIVLRRTDGAGGARRIELKPVDPETEPGRYRTELDHLAAGSYELTAAGDLPPMRVETDRFRVVRRRREMLKPEANPAMLRQLVGPAGERRFAPLEQMDRLADPLESEPLAFRTEQQRELLTARRAAGIILALVVALLAVEWFVRKRYNMA